MKKQLFSLSLLLSLSTSFASTSFAADFGKRDGREQHKDAGQRSDKLAQELGLNARQKAKVEKIFQEQQQQMQALRSRSADRSQGMAEAKRIHESTDKKLKDVLSKKQYAQLETKRQERQRQMGQRNDRRGDDSRRDDNRRDFGGRSRS